MMNLGDAFIYDNLFSAAAQVFLDDPAAERRFCGGSLDVVEERLVSIQNELIWRKYRPGRSELRDKIVRLALREALGPDVSRLVDKLWAAQKQHK